MLKYGRSAIIALWNRDQNSILPKDKIRDENLLHTIFGNKASVLEGNGGRFQTNLKIHIAAYFAIICEVFHTHNGSQIKGIKYSVMLLAIITSINNLLFHWLPVLLSFVLSLAELI